MAETLNFVYVLLLVISIFLVIIVCDSAYLTNSQPCITEKDCPRVRKYIPRCRKGTCQYSTLR
ncbi:putative Late nodulin [Medicago truncatula]|uniref:Putative Late nodulin n=1 Tax=Medicago truncatula TaxID=3880 RepID=A0A396GVB4_MEDTR|nr:putative Late nodulin [Medicago truncatula]